MKRLLIALFFAAACQLSIAQSISNVSSIQQGNDAVVSYDLNGASGADYFVRLYYSTDGGANFSSELSEVTGDVKSAVKAGTGKKIIWAAHKEVNFLNGPVVFKVEAEVRKAMPKPVTIESTTVEITKAKRNGNQLTIEFILIQNSETEVVEYRLRNTCQLAALDGKQFLAKSGKLGPFPVVHDTSQPVDCIKGIAVRGEVTFNVDNNDLVIPAVKIALFDQGFHRLEMSIKNIPVE